MRIHDIEHLLDQETKEGLQDLALVMDQVASDMIRVTCRVYLRNKCFKCVRAAVLENISDFTEQHSLDEAMNDLNQFMRQLTLWARDQAEQELKHNPCGEHDDD